MAFLEVSQNWREQRALLPLHSASIFTKLPILCNVQNKFGWSQKQFILSKQKFLFEKKPLNFHIGKLNLYLNMHIYISCSYWVISWKYVKGLWVAMIRKGPKLTDRQDTIIIPSTTHCVRYKNMVRIACDFCASTSLTIFCNRKYN